MLGLKFLENKMVLSKTQKNITKAVAVFLFLFYANSIMAAGGASGPVGSVILDNPLKVGSIYELIVSIAKIAAQVGASVAVVYLILSGFKFVTAQGDSTAVGKARTSFYHALIGTAVILGAWLLAEAIQGTIKSLGG